MIKEKLMEALKKAAADYNAGLGANAAVAKAAEAFDFNEKQAERLSEMFNTLAALNKEKDASDPTGSCELASKEAVIKELLGSCGAQKAASAEIVPDYSFYGSSPVRTNETIAARESGRLSIIKAAGVTEEEPSELQVSQRSLYKIISGKIECIKSAAAAADDVVRNIALANERETIKIAKAIEDPFADPELADLFKAACPHENVVENVAEYSTKVAESTGGRFAKLHVFDSSKVDGLLKAADAIDTNAKLVSEYEKKRDFYLEKAAEAENEMLEAVGLKQPERPQGLADLFVGTAKKASEKEPEDDPAVAAQEETSDAGFCMKVATLIRESGVDSDQVAKLAEDLEKEASINMGFAIPFSSAGEVHGALSKHIGMDSEQKRINNVRRSVILADLMSNDPIIRDADPEIVTEAYKTMVMAAPRVSLDKSQARAFLRSAVNSVAISPSDAKVLGEVDKYTAYANANQLDNLTRMDSSIKDSNV